MAQPVQSLLGTNLDLPESEASLLECGPGPTGCQNASPAGGDCRDPGRKCAWSSGDLIQQSRIARDLDHSPLSRTMSVRCLEKRPALRQDGWQLDSTGSTCLDPIPALSSGIMRLAPTHRLVSILLAVLTAVSQPVGALAHGLAHAQERALDEQSAHTPIASEQAADHACSASATDHDDASFVGDRDADPHHQHAVLHINPCATLTLAVAWLVLRTTELPPVVYGKGSPPGWRQPTQSAAFALAAVAQPRAPPIG